MHSTGKVTPRLERGKGGGMKDEEVEVEYESLINSTWYSMIHRSQMPTAERRYGCP